LLACFDAIYSEAPRRQDDLGMLFFVNRVFHPVKNQVFGDALIIDHQFFACQQVVNSHDMSSENCPRIPK